MASIEKFSTPKRQSEDWKREEINDFHLRSVEVEEGDLEPDASFEGLMKTETFLERNGGEIAEEVYDWYAQAMQRRDRLPLDADRFFSHFFENNSVDSTYMYGNLEQGYLLGYTKHGVFIPTHFAPKTLRGGYELIKELGENTEVPSVMAVTDDLVKTIEKLPQWKVMDLGFLAAFRGSQVEKKVVYNAHPDVKNLMKGLLSEYLESKQLGTGEEYSKAA